MSYPSSTPRIPLEVIETIIDNLHSNVPALREFALTCRALLVRCRCHLFYAVRFQPTEDDAYQLCHFLDAHEPLAAIVQAVTVYFPDRSRPAKSLIEVFPASLIKRLPRLRHWKLFTGATRSPETPLSFHHTTLALLRTTNCLETLELKDLTFTSNTELARLLTSLPRLYSLRCFNISVNSQHTNMVESPTLIRRRHRSMRSLYFARKVQTSLLRFLVEFSSTTLEELHLGYSQICTGDDYCGLGKIQLQNLATLTFFDDCHSISWEIMREFIETSIKTIHSPTVKHVFVVIDGRVCGFAMTSTGNFQVHPLGLHRCGKDMSISTPDFEGDPSNFFEFGRITKSPTGGGPGAHSPNVSEYPTSTMATSGQQHDVLFGVPSSTYAHTQEIEVWHKSLGRSPLPSRTITPTLCATPQRKFSHSRDKCIRDITLSVIWGVRKVIRPEPGRHRRRRRQRVALLTMIKSKMKQLSEGRIASLMARGMKKLLEKCNDALPYTLDALFLHPSHLDLASKLTLQSRLYIRKARWS